ncbi:hypothetical protein SmJEL517_g05783 [Synchytrium microbalum]|uniref:Steroid 5-alpha reductase C-terminal domain-containing protein n=1 Tax=Synchytrium microbalum TaxID=1806994 RepID=A0A507BTX6_9FUNG|nr:uncharacterized protein SmJEL517_g05783 [Synchytrium microbalum]TPX30701.1 hypothetical protein SmJEL517_g05783 [Synchytrium microbalum]
MTASVGINLLAVFLLDFAIQFVCFVFAAIFKTEKFYDLSGSVTYIGCILISLLYRHGDDILSNLTPRQIIIAALVCIWAVRLGTFLFIRVMKEGKDARFDGVKENPLQFSVYWALQVVWIYLTALPCWIVLGNDSYNEPNLVWSDYVGIVLWVYGFLVEVIADTSKFVFKLTNRKDFISTGIWKYCRYANYHGEIVLWLGMWILCIHGFTDNWQFVSIISPLFVAGLILGVSGVPLAEASAEKRYGGRADYQAYKAATPKYFLWFPKKLQVTNESQSVPEEPVEERRDPEQAA